MSLPAVPVHSLEDATLDFDAVDQNATALTARVAALEATLAGKFLLPSPVPFWYGYPNATSFVNANLTLNLLNIPYSQGGMVAASGGVRVPLTGFYQVSVKFLVEDATAASNPNFTAIQVLRNGAAWANVTSDTSFITSQMFQYHQFAVTQKQQLAANDLLQIIVACFAPGGATLSIPAGDGMYVSYQHP